MLLALACGRSDEDSIPPDPEPVKGPPAAAAAAQVLPLTEMAAVEGRLAGGETHLYALPIGRDRFLRLRVEQRGIDVELLVGDRADPRRRVDNPYGANGPEHLSLIAGSDEPLTLQIRALEERADPGSYTIGVEAWRAATEDDRDEVQAEDGFARGEELRGDGGEKSLRRALGEYQQAVSIFRALGAAEREADVLYRLGQTHLTLGETTLANEALRRVLDLLPAKGREMLEIITRNNLAVVEQNLGRPQGMREQCRRALELSLQVGHRWGEATAHLNYGRAAADLGQLYEAFQRYEKALDICRQLARPKCQVDSLRLLGLLYSELDAPQIASDLFTQALALPLNSADRALTLGGLGVAEAKTGQLEAGAKHLRQALEIHQENGNARETAITLSNLGWLSARQGEQDVARNHLEAALDRFEALGMPREQAAVLANLAVLLAENMADPEAALIRAREARKLFAQVGDLHGEATTLANIAWIERQRSDHAASLTAVEHSLELSEELRAGPLHPELQAQLFAGFQNRYDLIIDLLMEMAGESNPGRGVDRSLAVKAFELNERRRARSLLDLLAASQRQGLPAAAAKLEASLRQRGEKRLAGERANDETTDDELELRTLVRDYRALQAAHRAPRPEAASPLSLAAIRDQVLDEDTLLLAYSLGRSRSFLWALTRDELQSFVLPPAAELEGRVKALHRLIVKNQSVGKARRDQLLQRLSDDILGPAAGLLHGQRLLIVADGALLYLPFAALPVADATTEQPKPLGEDHPIVHLPSASVAAFLRRERCRRPPPGELIALVADPVHQAADPRFSGQGVVEPEPPAELPGAPNPFARLHFSGREAQAIEELVGRDRAWRALGFEAHREALLDGRASSFQIIHLAVHGVLDEDYPELSGLVLSGLDAAGRLRPWLLPAFEIARLELAADLVVLSACETALGKPFRGEGLVGLTQAWLRAGAAQVLVSLWPVDDEATAFLMTNFYHLLIQDGRSPAAALQGAQNATRDQPRWRSPLFWAGFVLVGDCPAS